MKYFILSFQMFVLDYQSTFLLINTKALKMTSHIYFVIASNNFSSKKGHFYKINAYSSLFSNRNTCKNNIIHDMTNNVKKKWCIKNNIYFFRSHYILMSQNFNNNCIWYFSSVFAAKPSDILLRTKWYFSLILTKKKMWGSTIIANIY